MAESTTVCANGSKHCRPSRQCCRCKGQTDKRFTEKAKCPLKLLGVDASPPQTCGRDAMRADPLKEMEWVCEPCRARRRRLVDADGAWDPQTPVELHTDTNDNGHHYDVAVLSLGRSATVVEESINTLKRSGVPLRRIWLFITKDEQRSYKNATDFKGAVSWTQGKTFTGGKIVVGVLTISGQRNFISNFFPAARHVVEVSDDLTDITTYSGRKHLRCTPLKDLPAVIEWCGAFMCDHRAKLWGLCQHRNLSWMRAVASISVGLVEGTFAGYVNRPFLDFRTNTTETEDVERSLKFHAEDGQLLRLQSVVCNYKENYMSKDGGMGKDVPARLKRRKQDLNNLVRKEKGKAKPRLTINKRPAKCSGKPAQPASFQRDGCMRVVGTPRFR